jgi:hypothetical protein
VLSFNSEGFAKTFLRSFIKDVCSRVFDIKQLENSTVNGPFQKTESQATVQEVCPLYATRISELVDLTIITLANK